MLVYQRVVGRRSFPSGFRPIFRGSVSLRECNIPFGAKGGGVVKPGLFSQSTKIQPKKTHYHPENLHENGTSTV